MKNLEVKGMFPVIVTPKLPMDLPEFFQTVEEEKTQLKQLLLNHGAVLLRGFPMRSPLDFELCVEACGLGEFVNYIGGDSPRDKVKNKVYTSTEAPPDLHIPLHQEMSYIKKFPRHIYFFCEIEPVMGGETIIADARRVLQNLDVNVTQRFEQNQLTYVSHYYYQSKIMAWVNKKQRSHKSWIEVFETEKKEEVEKRCLENEFEFRWLQRDWLEIKQTRPALFKHPETNEKVWFNQAHLYDFNPKLLGWKRYLAAKLFYFNKSTRLHEIEFADGSTIPRQDLYHILDVLNESTVAFPWKQGDVLILDNILSMHGRAPFHGKRRILTALTI